MSKKTSHYKANGKHGFQAGELAALLASHSPNAEYKVLITFRGKVRELIVEDEHDPGGVVYDQEAKPVGDVCETPSPANHVDYGDVHPPRGLAGGSMRRGWDSPRPELSRLDRMDGLR